MEKIKGYVVHPFSNERITQAMYDADIAGNDARIFTERVAEEVSEHLHNSEAWLSEDARYDTASMIAELLIPVYTADRRALFVSMDLWDAADETHNEMGVFENLDGLISYTIYRKAQDIAAFLLQPVAVWEAKGLSREDAQIAAALSA